MVNPVRTTAYVGSSAALGAALLSVAPVSLAMKIRRARKAVRSRANPDNVPPTIDGVYGNGPNKISMLVLGDSLAAGLGSPEPTGTVPGIVAKALAEAEDGQVAVTSKARVTSRMRHLPDQLDRALQKRPSYDYALIITGANDMYHPELGDADVRETLGETVAKLTAAGTAVVVVTCPNMSIVVPSGLKLLASYLSWRLARIQEKIAHEVGAVAVPCHPNLPQLVDDLESFFCSDSFHPSGEGYIAVADYLTPAVLEAVRQSNTARIRIPAVTGPETSTVKL